MKLLNAIRIAVVVALAIFVCAGATQGLTPKQGARKPTTSSGKKKPTKPATPAKAETPSSTAPPKNVTPAKTDPASDALPAGSPADFKPGTDPEGFRDKKWGTPYSEFSGMKEDIGSSVSGHKLANYTKNGDDLSFGSVVAEKIQYMFSEDKFYGVSINYSKVKDEQWDAITKSLIDQFGQVPLLTQNGQPTYIWWGEKTFIRVRRSADDIYLDFWSKYFFPGPDTDIDVFERAVELGDMPRIKKMLADKPELCKASNDDGQGPLIWSLNCHPANAGTDILEFLISKGADVNQKAKDGTTPLYRAATLGDLETVKLLIGKDAEVDMKAWHGETALLASGYLHSDISTYLIFHNADVNVRGYNGQTPLHQAAQGGKDDLVKLMIQRGADVNAKDNDGWSPLHEACTMMGSEGSVKLLIENGADVNARESKDGRSPLHIAVDDYRDDAVKLLLDNKADVNARDNKGLTPLKYAEDDDLPKVVELLKAQGGTD